MFVKQGNRRVWKCEDGAIIWLPCDKKTFRIVDQNFDMIDARKFRSLEAAIKAAV